MRLISWNVNGFRAILNKNFDDIFQRFDADFVCLQETKLQAGQASYEPEGYVQYWNYAQKKGYSGTCIFARQPALSVHTGLNDGSYDDEGRVLTLEYPQFYLVNVYVPNSQDGLTRLDYRLNFEQAMREYLSGLDRLKPVILCGDLNVAHQPIDLKNPKTNTMNPGYTIQERNAFQSLLDLDFLDSFRTLYPDRVAYTWWSYRFQARAKNIGWRIDYFVLSQRLQSLLCDSLIYDHIEGSDHCPVALELQYSMESKL
jgi:exodeoxyribonuclease-3